MVTRHKYYPFGEEATIPPADDGPMKFTGHERDFFEGGEADDLDYMHARYCSPFAGRFLSTDPMMQVKRAQKMPQLWNHYAYGVDNPLKFTDPTGETINLVFDFSGTDLDMRQRIIIARGIKARLVNAGVKDVKVHYKGGLFKGNDKGGTNATVHLKFVTRDVGGKQAFGITPGNPPGNSSEISLTRAPASEAATLSFLINVGSHEAGHGSQALPQFNMDAAPVGSILHPVGAEGGSIMETNVPAERLGAGPREFSASDAKHLREELNEEPPQ
jgi:RHS repeat-associated protein